MSDRLMQLFNFTASDLDYNRSGMLSPQQQQHITVKQRRLKRINFVFSLIMLTIAAGWVGGVIEGIAEGLKATAIGAGIFGLLGIVTLAQSLTPVRRQVAVDNVTGRAKIARIHHTTTSNNHTSSYVNTEMHIGDRIFVVPDAAFGELEDGAEYAVYTWSWKARDEILSLEKV